MVVYEVNSAVDADLRADYLAWLRPHVDEILALPGFTGADAFEVREPVEPGEARFCMQFRLVDDAALQAYLRDHAPRLRAEGVARFGARMRAQRRVMVPLAG